jgi:hypothetical protein
MSQDVEYAIYYIYSCVLFLVPNILTITRSVLIQSVMSSLNIFCVYVSNHFFISNMQ